jgi:hypothetical protein
VLARGYAEARNPWLVGLPIERKVEHLFELEILLKWTGLFRESTQSSWAVAKMPVVTRDFREQASLVSRSSRPYRADVTHLARRWREGVRVSRYLQTVLPTTARGRGLQAMQMVGTPRSNRFSRSVTG